MWCRHNDDGIDKITVPLSCFLLGNRASWNINLYRTTRMPIYVEFNEGSKGNFLTASWVPGDTHITVWGLLIVEDPIVIVKYRTAMKAIFHNFNLCLSIMLDNFIYNHVVTEALRGYLTRSFFAHPVRVSNSPHGMNAQVMKLFHICNTRTKIPRKKKEQTNKQTTPLPPQTIQNYFSNFYIVDHRRLLVVF